MTPETFSGWDTVEGQSESLPLGPGGSAALGLVVGGGVVVWGLALWKALEFLLA